MPLPPRQLWKQVPEQEKTLLEALTNPLPGETLNSFCQRLAVTGVIPRSAPGIRKYANRLIKQGKVQWQPIPAEGHTDPQFPDMKQFPDDPEALEDAIVDWQKTEQSYDRTQEQATVKIDSNLPIAVAWRGDWHVGGLYTDHQLLFEHTSRIAETPGVYAAELGDFGEQFIQAAKRGGIQEQVARPKTQRHLVWHRGRQLADSGSLLVMLTGQHDSWAKLEADFDVVEWLTHDLKVPFLGYGGLLNIELPGVTYTARIRHTGRFNSAFNLLHSVLQMLRQDGSADIGVMADKHEAGILHQRHQGREIIALRPGTYKRKDDFSTSHGYAPAYPDMPVTILWPKRRRMLGFWDFDTGLEYLTYLRGGGKHAPARSG